MLKMVDGTGIIGVDMVCPLGGAVSPPQPPNYDNVEMEGVGSLMLPNSLKAPLERLELIGNSTQGENPAPDNPQEIKNAGRKSKNLFNIADLRVGQVQKDGTINEKSTHSRTAILDVPEDGKYRIAFNSNDDYTMLYFAEMYTNGVYSQPYVRVHAGNSNSLISLKKGKNILSFSTYNNNTQVDFPKDHNIMIAAESETLGYEPYGYLLDVKVTGKNLFDREKARDITNWIIKDGDGYAKFPIRVGKGNKATFSYTEKLTPGKGFYLGIAQSDTGSAVGWLYHSTEINLNNNKLTVVAKGDCLYLSCNKTSIQKFFDTIQTLQVEIGSEQTVYEPYTEQTLTLTSDRPITKWDKLVEQGGQIGWLYQSAAKEYIGDNSVALYDTGFCFKLSDKKIVNGEGYCKELKQYVPREENPCIAFNMSANIYAYTLNTQEIYGSTVSAIKEYLKSHPLHLAYKTETPEFAPLPQSEQDAIRALKTYYPTTVITVDGGELDPDIKATYRKEK